MNEETVTKYDKEASAEKLATAALVLGIISLVSTLCCCPFVFSAIGITLALLSKGAEKVLRPRAKTGLILSITGIGVSIIIGLVTIGFPIMMYMTNPQYKEKIKEDYVESLEQEEELYRGLYGDEIYEQMYHMIDNL